MGILVKNTENDKYKISRFLYILEAAFEYFISLLLSGTYLAKVTTTIGISDSLTGILTSFVSLGCAFQIVAIFLANKRPVKKWVTILHTINQLFFACIYLVPFFNISQRTKIIFFILFLLLGHIINNIVNAPKTNWFMSLVDKKKRGSFTASKEMTSLIGGMTFTFVIGSMIDYYDEIGNVQGIFIYCSITVLILTSMHTCTLVFSKEKPSEAVEDIPVKQRLIDLMKDKKFRKIIVICSLWSIANYATVPFYGTYQIKELGFSMLFVSFLSAMYSVIRALASKPFGKYADKYSFIKMLNICFILMFSAFFVNIFTVPSNGKVYYVIYNILYALGTAGITNGEMNLIYDNIEKRKRVDALALRSTFSGIVGFFTTIMVSPLVDYIQRRGNIFLSMNVYAQQVLSAIGALIVLVILVYVNANKELKRNN